MIMSSCLVARESAMVARCYTLAVLNQDNLSIMLKSNTV